MEFYLILFLNRFVRDIGHTEQSTVQEESRQRQRDTEKLDVKVICLLWS